MKTETANRLRHRVACLFMTLGVGAVALWGGKPSRSSAIPLQETERFIYEGGLQNGWQDWSWAERRLLDMETTYRNKPSIRMTPQEYKGLLLHATPFSPLEYESLRFAIHGGEKGGQSLIVCLQDETDNFGKKIPLVDYLPNKKIPAGKFEVCTIPLSAFEQGKSPVAGICFQDLSGTKTQSFVYLANVHLIRRKIAAPADILLDVDATKELGAINPHIYGIAQPAKEFFDTMKIPLTRWGGNPSTRYNWELGNAWNATRDWYFRNGNYGSVSPESKKPSGIADKAIAENKTRGAEMILTIPTIGWVARNDSPTSESKGVPPEGGDAIAPGSDTIQGYDPAENRKRVAVRSMPRKGRPFSDPPDLKDETVYQDEWVNHLVKKFGKANAGGVKLYAMDNEPDLWDATHTDVRPVRLGYEEMLRQFTEYATAVKDVDSGAQILGPVSWGWTGYFFSPKDRGKDNFLTHAERKAHGDMPFLPWFLEQVAKNDRQKGRRTLDYLDVHFYPAPEGVYSAKSDATTNALRLRSTRALWDPDYGDESWIHAAVQLIPRLKQWIQKHYPGTKIAITEWNWGADNTMNGGLAIADVLGIFGRERLDLACYWASPPANSPGFFAYKMFLNADGKGNGFGDTAVQASSNSHERISVFGSVDSKTGKPIILLVNKTPQEKTTATLQIKSNSPLRSLQGYRYSEEDTSRITSLPPLVLVEGKARITLPPYSITLLRGQ